MSVPREFGGNAPLKELPPIIGQSIAPRTSRFMALEVDDVRPSATRLASSSLSITVFEVPSPIPVIRVPLPTANRSP
ncbi:hypothetical protein [Gemmata massiliana]|uniref:hypothetical protein n=1 Tax=Gemmata massiliana TaxID=1210884 RepID=UPI0013A68D20|nr:hypothetical protein [Gemmata massiliana]